MRATVSFAIAALIMCAAAPALAQKVDPEFLKARQARIQAMNQGDQAAFDRYTADAFFVVGGTGTLESRAQRVARANVTRQPPAPYLDEKITPYGDDTVILSWRTSGQGGGSRMLEVWVKERGTWRTAAVQTTPIQPPKK